MFLVCSLYIIYYPGIEPGLARKLSFGGHRRQEDDQNNPTSRLTSGMIEVRGGSESRMEVSLLPHAWHGLLKLLAADGDSLFRHAAQYIHIHIHIPSSPQFALSEWL